MNYWKTDDIEEGGITMACICNRKTINGLGMCSDDKFKMGLELDIPDYDDKS